LAHIVYVLFTHFKKHPNYQAEENQEYPQGRKQVYLTVLIVLYKLLKHDSIIYFVAADELTAVFTLISVPKRCR
jgi:hypothetical protein